MVNVERLDIVPNDIKLKQEVPGRNLPDISKIENSSGISGSKHMTHDHHDDSSDAMSEMTGFSDHTDVRSKATRRNTMTSARSGKQSLEFKHPGVNKVSTIIQNSNRLLEGMANRLGARVRKPKINKKVDRENPYLEKIYK